LNRVARDQVNGHLAGGELNAKPSGKNRENQG
jgi:hypothetical protein